MMRAYDKLLNQYPFITRVVQTGLIVGAGDILAQTFLEKNESFDFPRFRGATLTGAFFVAPALYFWYTKSIPRIIAALQIKSQLKATLVSTALDQTGFVAFFMVFFFIFLEYFKSFSLEAGLDTLKRNYWNALLANWKVWPPVILVNYYYVPMMYQPLFINFVALFWNCYLSYQNTQTKIQTAKAAQEKTKEL